MRESSWSPEQQEAVSGLDEGVNICDSHISLWKKRAEDGGCSHYGGNGRLQPHHSPWPSAMETPMWRSAKIPSSSRHEHKLSQAPAAQQVNQSRV